MFYEGINALTGIIPIPDQYDITHNAENISKVFVVDHYHVCKGSPCKPGYLMGFAVPKVGSLVGPHKFTAPSYSEIKTENTIHDPADHEILINAEITPGMDVLLNGVLIASAPEYKQQVTGKTKKLTQPERARFCRGVIWWLMNDENCLKDKLSEIGYATPGKITGSPIDELMDHIVENITLSPFPGPACLDIIPYDKYVVDTLKKELIEEGPESPYEITGSYLDADNNPETADQIINAFFPVPIQPPVIWIKAIPHLNLIIRECALS